MDIKDLDKKNDLRNLDEKLELSISKFYTIMDDMEYVLIHKNKPVGGEELQEISSKITDLAEDFRKNIIDYLEKYR